MADGVTTCGACGKAAGQSAAPAAGGVNDNLAGALCYIWIAAIIFLLIEPYNKNKTIRFHAFQGLFLGLAWFAGNLVLGITVFLVILYPFWNLGMLIVAILCAVKAYQNQKMKLPILGDLAEKQANA